MPDAETIEQRLRDHATDWNGEQMPDNEPAKGDPTAGTLREAADLIASLRADRDVLREALRDVVRANTENCRQRDLFGHHLRAVTDALATELTNYECVDEPGLIGWLGEDMGRRIIRARIANEAARAALADHISDVREMVAEDAADERRAIADWLLRKADASSVESIEGALRMAAEAIDMGAHREQADG